MRYKTNVALALLIPLVLILAVFNPYNVEAQIWERVNENGFGDPNNVLIRPMSVFDGNLYAGTMNAVTGCEVWMHDDTTWTQVNEDGFGNPDNIYASSMGATPGGL